MAITLKSFNIHSSKPQLNTIAFLYHIVPGFLFALITLLFFLSLAPPIIAAEIVMPGPRDRCPVCGMFVAPYPAWIAQIEFNDNSREFFDGPKDMFRYYLLLPQDGPTQSKDTIKDIYVTEYYSTKMLQAETLFFVRGSNIHGPMGHELIPLHTMEAAETFKRDHAGSTILTFDQITIDMLSDNK